MKKNKKVSIILISSIITIIVAILYIIKLLYFQYHHCGLCAEGCCGFSKTQQFFHDLKIIDNLYNIIVIYNLIMIPLIIIKSIKKRLSKTTITTFIIGLILILAPSIKEVISNKNDIYDMEWDKPIIYIYPTEKTRLTITLDNDEKLLYSYPQYNDSWEIIVDKDSTIYDLKTKRKNRFYSSRMGRK